MSKTKLSAVIRQSALMSPERDTFWPISDQYIGLEIEIENYSNRELRNHLDAGSPFWTQHDDGSLRNGTELVLSQALMGTTLREAVSYFFRTFKSYTASPRTSIHVHVNMRQDEETVEGTRNMVALYYMYENAFFTIAEENRKWCSYCNPFEDTPPAILEAFMNLNNNSEDLTEALHRSAGTNTNRYYGLNLNAMAKFGTIEFRHFPLVHEEQRLIDWIKLIMELKAAANRMADEGHTPWSLFVQPEDLNKLRDYMPQFGGELLNLVPASRALHRMTSVRNLGTATLTGFTKELVNNKAFANYKEVQNKKGNKAKELPPFHNDKLCAALRNKLEAYAEYARERDGELRPDMQREVESLNEQLSKRIELLTAQKKMQGEQMEAMRAAARPLVPPGRITPEWMQPAMDVLTARAPRIQPQPVRGGRVRVFDAFTTTAITPTFIETDEFDTRPTTNPDNDPFARN